ncbi:hypothetical protein RJT34_32838 [Clitoria ternatea]|uniref:Uncharacterized protein n=1 Tax=Clitoria ternatea TaxID=43366 RepID=A0AAN9I450_CLITE
MISDTRKRHQMERAILSFHLNCLRHPAREYSRSAIMFLPLHSIDIESNKPNPNTLTLSLPTLHLPSSSSSSMVFFSFNSDR